MKLLYCTNCGDIFNLNLKLKECSCGETKGLYVNTQDAVYSGEYAVFLGIDNTSFHEALKTRPLIGMGSKMDAFAIPLFSNATIKLNDCPGCTTFEEAKKFINDRILAQMYKKFIKADIEKFKKEFVD